MIASWRAKKVIHLDQTSDRVFKYLLHWDRVSEWDPSVIEAHPSSELPPKVGSRYRIALRFGGQRVDMTYSITDMVPNRSIELTGKGRRFQVVDRIHVQRSTPGRGWPR